MGVRALTLSERCDGRPTRLAVRRPEATSSMRVVEFLAHETLDEPKVYAAAGMRRLLAPGPTLVAV